MKLPNMTLHPNCIPLRSMQSGELGRYPTFDCFDPYTVQKSRPPISKILMTNERSINHPIAFNRSVYFRFK